ncbi:MAG: ribulokinase, partial [Ilumatobacteraceae bacterium]|nr:ribulokinase [Ilumatobacteraceae bacterium]
AHGVMDGALASSGQALPPDWALQVPRDYVDSMVTAVRAAMAATSDVAPGDVIGIGTDFTACTVLPTLADGTPLCELDTFVDRPHAYVKLWKHHAAQGHADRLNEVAHTRGESWIHRYGGKLSSEWELAKGLQLLEEDPEVYAAMDRWVEAADWIVWQLCGTYVRNACASGFKAAFQDGAYPSPAYFAEVNPAFEHFIAEKVEQPIGRLGERAGGLTAAMAERLGLREGIAVCVGNVDAHVTAPAAGAVAPGQLVAIMGTSTCHVMSGADARDVAGICGIVEDGIVPGLWAYEAGQSGVGDIFGWFVDQCVPPYVHTEAAALGLGVHEHLTDLALQQPVGGHGLIALDWHSGNRSVLVDHDLSGLVVGFTLATRPADVYRALIEATAFGARVIVERLEAAGVPVIDFIVAGGLLKNRLVMQVYADVLRRPLHVIGSDQAPALGSAMHAAVAAGAYGDIVDAAKSMASLQRDAWLPDTDRADAYDRLFAIYRSLHDHFGDDPVMMHSLRALRREALLR